MVKASHSNPTYEKNVFENKKRNSIADLPELFMATIYKVTNKRWQRALQILEKVLPKESERLFSLIAYDSIGVEEDPYKGTPYSTRVWQRLSEAWIEKKDSDLFWYSTGKLQKWFLNTKTSSVMGNPKFGIKMNNPKAKGFQLGTIVFQPFPYLHNPRIDDIDIRNRLFMTNWGGDVNEEVRPIIAPAARALIDEILEDKIKVILKDVMEGKLK